MASKNYSLNLVSRLLLSLKVDNIFNRLYGGLGLFVMLHRVIPEKKSFRIHNHKTLEINIEQLEKIILFFKDRSYSFLSIDQFYSQFKKGELKKPFVVFTFDDGYKDNLMHAYPIFKKYDVPFTIYITTSFPDNEAIIWWYLLEEYIVKNNSLKFIDNERKYSYDLSSIDNKEKAFTEIRKIFIQKPENELRNFTKQVFNITKEDITKHSEENCLSWNEIAEMAKDPIVTIGAHTVNHLGLAHLSDIEAEMEITVSKRILEEKTGIPVYHFSYPFGGINEAGEREFEIAKRAGFRTAVTTQPGCIKTVHVDNMTSLPRISFNSSVSDSILRLNVSGIYPFIKKLKSYIKRT